MPREERRRIGILVVAYNAETTLASTLDRIPVDFRPRIDEILGLSAAGYSDLEQNSIHDETRLTVLQHLRDSIPSGSFKLDCRSVLAAYLVLREKA